MRRTKADAEITRQHVLQAAEELFLEQGYSNVSLEAIAAKAGVTRGAVHWHFKNKAGLLSAIRIKIQEPLFKLATDITDNDVDISLTHLGNQVSNFFDLLEADKRWQGLLRVIFKAELVQKEATGEEDTAFQPKLANALLAIFTAVEKEKGLPTPWTAQSACAMFSSSVTGLMLRWAVSGDKVALNPDGQAYVRMILEAFTVKPEN